MARQSGVSTPIFDQLLREMTERSRPPAVPASASGPAEADPTPGTPPAPRRRHRAD